MAVLKSEALIKRDYMCGYYSDGTRRYCSSRWHDWGRWVALVVIVIAALVVFFLLACLSARRRRRHGMTPYYGTGWAGRAPFGHGQATYNPNAQPYYANQNYAHQNHDQSAPPYSPPQDPNYYSGGQNQSYYGQQNGIELQQPPHTYNQRGGEPVYAPPSSPPPAKR